MTFTLRSATMNSNWNFWNFWRLKPKEKPKEKKDKEEDKKTGGN